MAMSATATFVVIMAAVAIAVAIAVVVVMATASATTRHVCYQMFYLFGCGLAVFQYSTFESEVFASQRVVQVYLHLFFTDFYDASVETLAFFVLQGNDSVFINMLVVEVSVDAEHLAV